MTGLLHHAAHTPEKRAFVLGNGEFVESYADLESRSRHIALWLRSVGLQEGDCVAVMMGNTPSFFDVYWATQRIGLYLTPLNWHLSAAEVAFVAKDCDARLLIAGGGLRDLARDVRGLLGTHIERYCSVDGCIEGFESLDEGLAHVPHGPLQPQRAGSVMIYSSGTTGKPKGIRKALPDCSFDATAWNQAQPRFLRLFGFTGDDRYLIPAPLYHAAPLRSCAAMQVLGGTVYAMNNFDASHALRIIDENKITVSQWVPTHFKKLLELPQSWRLGCDVSSLRVAVHAAAPCPATVKRSMMAWWGPVLVEYYAGTEGGGTLITSAEWMAHPGSVGRPWAGVDVQIMDDAGCVVTAPGFIGDIYFRDRGAGSTRFAYYKDEAKTAAAYRGDWFSLGDIGYLDPAGYLYLTDRSSDLIISGGVNVYPQETENCLLEHSGVADVAVIGVPDEMMGELVKAFVVPAAGFSPDSSLALELIAYSRDHIAHFKCPKIVDFVTQLPRTETGKLQRRLLRDRYQRAGNSSRDLQ